jgi:hypothetical protein
MYQKGIFKYFDLKIGIAGGVLMGLIVYLINYYSTYQLTGSITAALKQGLYTFFFGGFIMKMCEILSLKLNPPPLAVFLSMLLPSIISLGLTYGLHSMKGTPKPLESTLPTAVFVIPSTLVWGYINRYKRKQSS